MKAHPGDTVTSHERAQVNWVEMGGTTVKRPFRLISA